MLSVLPFATCAASLHAGTPAETWGYTLFNPTPRERMRELSTDRPDTTESPISVDAGHIQIEMSVFDYSRNDDGGIREEVLTYGATNVKFGLLDNVDLQIVFDAYTEVKTEDLTVGGFSDIQARLKINLWGNDGGKTALAFFPFIKIPTGTALSSDKVEGGIILPFSLELTDTIGLGLMAEADFVRQDPGNGYHTEFVHTAVIGFEVTGKLGAFVEYVGVAGPSAYQASSVVGLTYGLSDDLQLDAGLRLGLNEAAEDLGAFTGISVRF